MKETILDTNFILSCIRNKIDFFEEIKFMGFKILIPKEVINELEKIAKSKKKLKFRDESKIALQLLKKNPIEIINLEEKNTDKGIIKLSKKNRNYIVATLDKEIQEKVKNQKLIIRGHKKLEIS